MQPKILVTAIAASALLAGAALAQPRPMMGRNYDPAWMQQHHAQMCTDRYAHMVGKVAALQVELQLTTSQKPLFENWKKAVLTAAQNASDQCKQMKMPEQRPTLVQHLKFQEGMLQVRLDGLKAQMPALEALESSLDQTQQRVLDRSAMEMHGMHGMHGMMGHGGMHRGMGKGMMGPAGGPPPAQPQQ